MCTICSLQCLQSTATHWQPIDHPGSPGEEERADSHATSALAPKEGPILTGIWRGSVHWWSFVGWYDFREPIDTPKIKTYQNRSSCHRNIQQLPRISEKTYRSDSFTPLIRYTGAINCSISPGSPCSELPGVQLPFMKHDKNHLESAEKNIIDP